MLTGALILLVAAATIYVSPDGVAEAAGTAAAPRALGAEVLAAADEVVLLPGDYFLPDGIRIENRERPLVLRAQKPGSVRLFGGPATVPRVRDGRTRLPVVGEAFGVLEDGEPMVLARTPNEGYFRTVGPGADPKRQFIVPDSVAPLLSMNRAAMEVFSWPNYDWFSNRGPVSGWDPATRTLTTTELPGYVYQADDRFRLEGAPAFLDQPGEYARGQGELLLIPRRAGAKYTVITAPTLFHIKNVKGVRLEGLELLGAGTDLVRLEDATATTITGCRLTGGGETAIKSVGTSRDGRFVGNLIERVGQHGIDFAGPDRPTEFTNGRNLVRSNRIRLVGLRFGHGYGIAMHSSGENRIERNHISDGPRYAITLKGPMPPDPIGPDGLKSWPAGQYRPTCKNLIQGNRVERMNLDSEDTGSIETWNAGRDNVIDGNWIGRSGNPSSPIMSGLYLDDGADGYRVTRNVIYSGEGLNDNQAIFAKGVDNVIENNVLVVMPDAKAAVTTMEMANLAARRHELRRNVVWFAPRPVAAPERGRFDQAAGNLQDVGTTLTTGFRAPQSGIAKVWVRYASRSGDFGVPTMSGRTTLTAGAPPVRLQGLEMTNGWGDYRWTSAPAAQMRVEAGERKLVWRNDDGGGINLDAFLLDFTGEWSPGKPPSGPGIVVVHPESAYFPEAFSIVHWFVNDGPERYRAIENNFLTGDVRDVTVYFGAKVQPWADWLKENREKGTVQVPDPFVNAAAGDFRLKPGVTLPGFVPLPLREMGLGPEYPARFPR